MTRLGALLVTGACALGGACGSQPSKDDCEKLLGHLVDLELKAGGAGATTGDMKDDVARQREQVVTYVRDTKFVETCTQKTPKDVVACGLAAKTFEDVEACDLRK